VLDLGTAQGVGERVDGLGLSCRLGRHGVPSCWWVTVDGFARVRAATSGRAWCDEMPQAQERSGTAT
jgi:hypothetical protein